MGKLVHGRTCVFNINYHIVWSTKYRRKVLTEEIEVRLKKILQLEKAIKSKNDGIIFPKDIVYFTLSEGSCWAVTENGKEFELASSLAFYEKLLKDYFLKVHRAYLVSLDRIEGFYKRYPLEKEEDLEEVTRGKKVSDECELA